MAIKKIKYHFNIIQKITKYIREDDFWSKNLLSLAKLRKKNSDGIMYVVVFNEHLKTKTNGKSGKQSNEDIFNAVRDLGLDNR